MNKIEAKKLAFEMRESYFRAIKARDRQYTYRHRGNTTKALEQEDNAIAFIKRAEDAETKLIQIIEEA